MFRCYNHLYLRHSVETATIGPVMLTFKVYCYMVFRINPTFQIFIFLNRTVPKINMIENSESFMETQSKTIHSIFYLNEIIRTFLFNFSLQRLLCHKWSSIDAKFFFRNIVGYKASQIIENICVSAHTFPCWCGLKCFKDHYNDIGVIFY